MPVDPGLAALSDTLLFAAVVIYTLAMVGYAAELAFSGPVAAGRAVSAASRADAPVLAGAGGSPVALPPVALPPVALPPVALPPVAGASPPPPPLSSSHAPARGAPRSAGSRFGRVAVALTALGWGVHAAAALARGLAAGRVPWGNMYEFASMVALLAVTAYLVLVSGVPVARGTARRLGVFVLLPVVLLLGLAGTVLHAPAGPLVPALDSYWIKIHVAAAIAAAGTFTVAAVATVLYLVRERFEARAARGGVARRGLAGRLPTAAALDRTAYRVTAFAFPVWTFAIIAGAIWAEAAWGRYWGWDPKETWSFVSWVVYAGYLHARTTAGWRGRRAAVVALIGFTALVFNFFGVNLWITGLHSYAGV